MIDDDEDVIGISSEKLLIYSKRQSCDYVFNEQQFDCYSLLADTKVFLGSF